MLNRTPTPELVARVRLLAEQEGVSRAAKILGVAKEPLARVCGGLRVHLGTLAAMREALAAIDAREAAELAAVVAQTEQP